MTAQDWSDSVTPEEWAAERLGVLRGRTIPRADLSKIPAPDPLIEGMLQRASLSWLFGDRGSFKSFAALDMAGCVGTGTHWHGHAAKQLPVLYAALEGASGLHQRVEAWEDYHGIPMAGVNFLVPRSLHIVADAGPLTELTAELGAGLVIIDTQNRATVGLEENSSIDMGRMIAALDLVQQATSACVLVIHHTGSGSHRPRGHTSIDAAAQSMIRVSRDGALVKVTNEKQKDGPKAPSLLLTATPRLGSVVLVPEGGGLTLTDSEVMIKAALGNLVALNGSATHAEVKRACTAQGMPESTFNWALRRFVRRGGATKAGGKYVLVDDRQGQLDGFGRPLDDQGQRGWQAPAGDPGPGSREPQS